MYDTKKLKGSHLYRLVFKLQSGNGQWYKYEAYMTFLGQVRHSEETTWNLRPVAGTQGLPAGAILEAEDLGPTQGRDDRRHRAKKSLGRMPKSD